MVLASAVVNAWVVTAPRSRRVLRYQGR